MAEANDIYGSVYQNLIDSGCDSQIADQCMSYMREGKAPDMLPILKQYRSALLASVHTGQKQLDCLDFLIYRIKKL